MYKFLYKHKIYPSKPRKYSILSKDRLVLLQLNRITLQRRAIVTFSCVKELQRKERNKNFVTEQPMREHFQFTKMIPEDDPFE